MRKSPWTHLRDNPPAIVRLFARRKVSGALVAMSLQEVSIASGLPMQRCREISEQLNWANVTVDEAQRFIAGCGWDPLSYRDRNRKNAYTRSCLTAKSTFHYLRQSPQWKTEFAPLINRLRSKMSG